MTACLDNLKARFARRGIRPQVGFVPTMGALHEGHLALIRRARRENEIVVVSIFVNPLQFGPREDYRRYPRPWRRDAALCRRAGVDVVFAPTVRQLYPKGCQTFVDVTVLSHGLCGAVRPGHFRGVATVVAKLFNLVRPDRAYVGQKDLQQARMIQRMAQDLQFPIEIAVVKTVRERDGLAMSSRNAYLAPQERAQAAVIHRALSAARQAIRRGERDPRRVVRRIRQTLRSAPAARRVEYVQVVDAADLQPVARIRRRVAVACAVWVGRARLIDNVLVTP